MSVDGVNFTHDVWLLIHSAANKAPFTVSVFSLDLIFVLNRFILLNTLSHSALEWGKLSTDKAKFKLEIPYYTILN